MLGRRPPHGHARSRSNDVGAHRTAASDVTPASPPMMTIADDAFLVFQSAGRLRMLALQTGRNPGYGGRIPAGNALTTAHGSRIGRRLHSGALSEYHCAWSRPAV